MKQEKDYMIISDYRHNKEKFIGTKEKKRKKNC